MNYNASPFVLCSLKHVMVLTHGFRKSHMLNIHSHDLANISEGQGQSVSVCLQHTREYYQHSNKDECSISE